MSEKKKTLEKFVKNQIKKWESMYLKGGKNERHRSVGQDVSFYFETDGGHGPGTALYGDCGRPRRFTRRRAQDDAYTVSVQNTRMAVPKYGFYRLVRSF